MRHAIVIGSGTAGLFAARVLSLHCDQVTVVEKDPAPVSPAPRPGVPQGHHIHVLLAGGVRALDRLFPGGVDELVRSGVPRFDYGESRFHTLGQWMPQITTGLPTLAASRPFLEHHIRTWVGRIPNVRFRYDAAVTEPVLDRSGLRVAGIALRDGEMLAADLVIDASGRHSRLPAWLVAHGFGPVPEMEVGFDLGYATGSFRVPTQVMPDHPMLYIVGRAPRHKRVGVVVQMENGVVFGAMGGYQGSHPPGDLPGFLEFASSLAQPDVHRVLSKSELIGSIARFRIPSSVRRYYSRMKRFPAGILPIGDCVCSYDPAFGHGMSVAALEAEALEACLSTGGTGDYFRKVHAIVDVPWNLCCGENFKYPGTTGPRPLLFPITRRLKDRLAVCRDRKVITDFYGVVTLSARPRSLLRPRTIARALGI